MDHATQLEYTISHDTADAASFYEHIGRPELAHELSAERPYAYWTMEVYDESHGIKGGGGLGVLAADTRRVAEELQVPLVVITPFFRRELHQSIEDLHQTEWVRDTNPAEHGFEHLDSVTISSQDSPDTLLDVYEKRLGSTRFLTITEPNFGELYAGDGNGDHRLYQEVALGFGGYRALRVIGVDPPVIQLNETATIFAAIARLDELCAGGMSVYEAIVQVRKHCLYTNHTLIQGAEGEFSTGQFYKYVFPNVSSAAVRRWLLDQFNGDRLRLSTLAIELAEAKNGVSRLHAEVANFSDRAGEPVQFQPITNGIDMRMWVLPEIYELYRAREIIDRYGLPAPDYEQKIDAISAEDMWTLKQQGRHAMNAMLAQRKDQYGNHVELPDDALVFDFKRRFAGYKRPYMLFERVDELRQILIDYNAHLVMAGRVHQGDRGMYDRLHDILNTIDQDDLLRERVHYLQDYDEELGRALAMGGDAAINVPIVGLEACGTSWEKDIANFKLLISTKDGGVADIDPPTYLEVAGESYEDEVSSLYHQMRYVGHVVSTGDQLQQLIAGQLKAYLPIISGSRMVRDYLTHVFPG
jgi:alpha-glucan phosphorylase-like protein